MDIDELQAISSPLIEAWNDQDVERVVACYTDDLIYVDPNTRGAVGGPDAFSRYLTRLFSRWQMHWSVKETFPLADTDGAAGLWRASFRVPGGERRGRRHGPGSDRGRPTEAKRGLLRSRGAGATDGRCARHAGGGLSGPAMCRTTPSRNRALEPSPLG